MLPSIPRWRRLTPLLLALTAACDDVESSPTDTTSPAGAAGTPGAGGSAGKGGAPSQGGAGQAGSAGAGLAGAAGSAGQTGGGAGAAGTGAGQAGAGGAGMSGSSGQGGAGQGGAAGSAAGASVAGEAGMSGAGGDGGAAGAAGLSGSSGQGGGAGQVGGGGGAAGAAGVCPWQALKRPVVSTPGGGLPPWSGPCASDPVVPGPHPTPPDVDNDGDGYTEAQGDCDDCDPLISPDALDIFNTDEFGNPLPDAQQIDENCDGSPALSPLPPPCDAGLALADTAASSAARAIGLCEAPVGGVGYGVVSAHYVRADGTVHDAPGPQAGLLDGFGPGVPPLQGERMLALSTGQARVPLVAASHGPGVAPAGFPQDAPGCPASGPIHDDIGLELKVRAPSNVAGFQIRYRFYSTEYLDRVCSSHSDQFVILMDPTPPESLEGNIARDKNWSPVGVDHVRPDVCDPALSGTYAQGCDPQVSTCPGPQGLCDQGAQELTGTGFEGHGATGWLQASVTLPLGADGRRLRDFTLRLALWDAGDGERDSTVLVDRFEWFLGAGPVFPSCGYQHRAQPCYCCVPDSLQGCCATQWGACQADASCQAIAGCVQACPAGDTGCTTGCVEQPGWAAGKPLYQSAQWCVYGDASSIGTCGGLPACGG